MSRRLAQSDHLRSADALTLLGWVRLSHGGPLDQQRRTASLFGTGRLRNPFTGGPLELDLPVPSRDQLEEERRWIAVMKAEIQADIDVWLRIAREPTERADDAVYLLAAIAEQAGNASAWEAVRSALEHASPARREHLLRLLEGLGAYDQSG